MQQTRTDKHISSLRRKLCTMEPCVAQTFSRRGEGGRKCTSVRPGVPERGYGPKVKARAMNRLGKLESGDGFACPSAPSGALDAIRKHPSRSLFVVGGDLGKASVPSAICRDTIKRQPSHVSPPPTSLAGGPARRGRCDRLPRVPRPSTAHWCASTCRAVELSTKHSRP